MKYWLFDGNDIIGPFAPHELAGRKGFSPMSLVCPDGYSDRADHWQMASTFEELKPALNGEETAPAKTWEKEVDTLIKQEPAIEVDDTPTSPGSSLQVPKTPAKAGPIEEYFNTIRGEDLGNILGIPDPNENTDADLARVIENELGPALAPTDKEEYEPLRTPAQPAAAKPQAQKTISKAPQKQSKPAAQPPQPRKHPAQKKPAPKPQQVTREPDSPEGIRIIDLDEQKPAVLKTTPAPAPAKKAPVKKAAQGGPSKTITKNEVEIEKFDTGRIQEEVSSYKETPAETQTPAELPIRRRPARSQWLMALLACLLLFVLGRLLTQEENYVEEVTGSFKASAAEIFSRFTAAPTPPLPSGTTAVSAGEPDRKSTRLNSSHGY